MSFSICKIQDAGKSILKRKILSKRNMLSHCHHLFISPQLNSEPVNTCFYTGIFHNTRERHARGILVGATGSVTGPYRQAVYSMV